MPRTMCARQFCQGQRNVFFSGGVPGAIDGGAPIGLGSNMLSDSYPTLLRCGLRLPFRLTDFVFKARLLCVGGSTVVHYVLPGSHSPGLLPHYATRTLCFAACSRSSPCLARASVSPSACTSSLGSSMDNPAITAPLSASRGVPPPCFWVASRACVPRSMHL